MRLLLALALARAHDFTSYISGDGDVEFLEFLDTARRHWDPVLDPRLQTVGMLYSPASDMLVEGPTWGEWWTQNSYGPIFAALPFAQEPLPTWVNNSMWNWFRCEVKRARVAEIDATNHRSAHSSPRGFSSPGRV